MKAAAAGNLINWANNDNDNDLKHQIKQKFIGEEIRRRKLQELQFIKQENSENIESYTIRFKKILRIAESGINIPDIMQVESFIRELKGELVKQVRLNDSAKN